MNTQRIDIGLTKTRTKARRQKKLRKPQVLAFTTITGVFAGLGLLGSLFFMFTALLSGGPHSFQLGLIGVGTSAASLMFVEISQTLGHIAWSLHHQNEALTPSEQN